MTIKIGGGGYRTTLQLQLALEVFSDEFAVEAAVLDEDFVGALAGDDDSAEVDSGDVGLERCGVAHGTAVVRVVELHAEALDEVEVGVVAGEGEDEVVGDGQAARGRGDGYVVFGDVGDIAGEVGGDLAVPDAVVDVGQDPILHVGVHLLAAMDEGNARAVAPEVERVDGG